ncbi:MAG: leucine-rich repeat domain-containing protein [Bacteroidota bacterium]
MAIRTLFTVLLCCSFFVVLGQTDQDSVVVEDDSLSRGVASPIMDAELYLQPDSILLSPEELSNKRWYTNLGEAMRNPREVYKLSLPNQKLREIPSAVFRLPNLQVLDLSGNKLKKLPGRVADLQHLEILILTNNKLNVLPDEVKEMDNLRELYLRSNRLVEVPAWVGGLSKLRKMDISYNQLLLEDVVALQGRLPKCEVVY